MGIARAELADVLRAVRFGTRRSRIRRGRSTIEVAGVRIAMGATRGVVMRGIFWDAVRMAGPGLLVGGALAVGTAVALRSTLLGLSPVDPVSLLSAGTLLLLVVIASSLGPALRASGIHPMEALRQD